jgi:hypothetical protein
LSWQDLHSLTYIRTCSVLMSSLSFTGYLKSHNCEHPKRYFSCALFSQLALHFREMN